MIHSQKHIIEKWLDTNNFCAMPFFHVAVESNGDIRPCCLGDPLKNPDGTTLNIAGKTIKEIIDHPTHQEFRNTFLKNEQHPACNPCWGKFQNDRFSGRYMYSSSPKITGPVLKIIKGDKPEQKLMWLEIKAGNRCNLSCRICGLWNSSKWLKDAYNLKKELNLTYPEFKESQEYAYNRQAMWIDDVDFWKNIDGFDDIRLIHLMGGEPLMIPEHFKMLQAISEKFDPGKIFIWYNTNGTIIPSKTHEEILLKFKKIWWSVSIDDFGEKFNYQRKGAVWNEVKKNLPYFSLHSNYELSIDTTINVHNVITIHEFVKELQSMGISKHFSPHYVTSPEGIYNIRSLNNSIKEQVKSVLLEHKDSIDENFSNKVDEIINFMMSIDTWSEKIDQRRKHEIMFIDQRRGESFVKTFPEMSKLLNYV
jgi:MoaA/NifB/PqqE/SkfB family radical SAM enzyme